MRFVLFALAALLVSCTDDNEAIRALTNLGFRDIQITGESVFLTWECSKDDAVSYEATATNPAGVRVGVTVCCGGPLRFKGCTVRSR